MITWLRRIWNRILGWWRGAPKPFRTLAVDELPDELAANTLYLAGENEHFWCAAMLCPCGCGDSIQLNLLTQARPCWRTSRHEDGTVTLHPSVWRRQGCKSHFWFRRGFVEWCGADISNAG
ncbi:MAG: hypothetical protein JSR52_00900 [Planctomycetes bacterium]|nr:hypothetical protein [Planctomycetota bacterium]